MRERPPTLHLLSQASKVAEMIEAGRTYREMALALKVSGPRIAEIKKRLPELQPYLGEPAPLDRLRRHRDQLWRLRASALALAATIRADLRELDEEVQSAEIDQLLGLRFRSGIS